MGRIENERFRTGNRVEIYARGPGPRQLLGKGFTGRMGDATSVGANSSTGATGIYTTGTPHPQGIVDTRYEHTVRLALVQLTSRSAADKINADTVDIDLIDKFTNKKICTYEECHVQTGGINVPANQPVTEDISFLAMRVVPAVDA